MMMIQSQIHVPLSSNTTHIIYLQGHEYRRYSISICVNTTDHCPLSGGTYDDIIAFVIKLVSHICSVYTSRGNYPMISAYLLGYWRRGWGWVGGEVR